MVAYFLAAAFANHCCCSFSTFYKPPSLIVVVFSAGYSYTTSCLQKSRVLETSLSQLCFHDSTWTLTVYTIRYIITSCNLALAVLSISMSYRVISWLTKYISNMVSLFQNTFYTHSSLKETIYKLRSTQNFTGSGCACPELCKSSQMFTRHPNFLLSFMSDLRMVLRIFFSCLATWPSHVNMCFSVIQYAKSVYLVSIVLVILDNL